MSTYDLNGKKVYVAGHNGMVGSAICRRLEQEACNILVAPRSQLDLLEQDRVTQFLGDETAVICAL